MILHGPPHKHFPFVPSRIKHHSAANGQPLLQENTVFPPGHAVPTFGLQFLEGLGFQPSIQVRAFFEDPESGLTGPVPVYCVSSGFRLLHFLADLERGFGPGVRKKLGEFLGGRLW